MTPYDVLGLHPGASLADTKARYRMLARLNHPDAGGSAERFRQIKEAYEKLTKGKIEIPGEGKVDLWALTGNQRQGIKNRLALRLGTVEFQERGVESRIKMMAEDDPRIAKMRDPLKEQRAAIEKALATLDSG